MLVRVRGKMEARTGREDELHQHLSALKIQLLRPRVQRLDLYHFFGFEEFYMVGKFLLDLVGISNGVHGCFSGHVPAWLVPTPGALRR